ncbi:photo-regulated tyrosinase [Vararia minispora EC-137]|uniref:Photo-regulated tyrosinase n=1 Tax=Vararia minispora EC-137 TaxID=1314806 RepID=A0ACB8QLS4_9AGAM|nr:photo-regulated tyrosinase [Vararia minispora EC-137]
MSTSTSHFVISGAKGGNAAGADAPNRIEINNLVKIEDQFSLYIQALTAMSKDNQSDLTSFFQIGGIHGLPYIQWDGSGAKEPVAGSWGGYCTHGSVLFPTWHRPYVALFEALLQRHAVEIAKTYAVDQERWNKAAMDLRAPYWDWAANSVPPSEVIADKQVTITLPDGTRAAVDNPLYGYVFHPIDPSFPQPYSQWQSTLRHPTTDGPDAQTDVEDLTDTLQSAQDDITSSTYRLLTRVHTWPAFSNHSVDDGGSASNSLEAIHDGIHVDVGGNGQMADPSVAGFDPIFFLHHANVDRMLSLWSALNPGVWTSNGPAEGGTYTIPPDASIGPTTQLTPFWESQSAYWLSSQTTATSKLGYTYPEFNGLNMADPGAVKSAIARIVNSLYGGSIFGVRSAPPLAQQAALTAEAVDEKPFNPFHPGPVIPPSTHNPHPPASHNPGSSTGLPPIPVNDWGSSLYDWAVRIHVKKYALGGSFSVLIFLGTVPSNPREWRKSPSFVGAHHVFVNSSASQCANCREQEAAGMVSEGFVHLDTAIARLSRLGSFDPPVVEPYLKRELSWRVIRANKTVVDLNDLPSLEVLVCATKLTLEDGADLPNHGAPQYFRAITAGRRGGAKIE